MSEEIFQLLEELEAVLTKGGRLPFLRRLLVDEEEAVALLDRLRAAVPEEVRRARQVLQEREAILEQARQQAREIVEQTQQEAAVRLEEGGLLEEAKARSAQIVADARREAEAIREGADDYAREVLTEIEARVSEAHQEIQETLGRILLSVRKGLAELSGEVRPGSE